MRFSHLALAFCLSLVVNANFVVVSHKGNGAATGATGHNGTHGAGNRNTDERKCAEISRLTRLQNLVNNATALQELQTKRNLTTDEVQKIKDEATNATSKLNTLTSNSTLVSECATINAAQNLKQQCRQMTSLTEITTLADNATALQELQTRRNLTDAQLQKIKDKAANATTKLQELQSNRTLVAACNNLKTSKDGSSSSGTGTAAAAQATSSTSAARRSMSSATGVKFLANGVLAAGMCVLAAMLAL